MKNTVLFDLGGTLAQYFGRAEFPALLRQAIGEVQRHLRRHGLLRVSPDAMWRGVANEDHEASDYRVRPLEERLRRIFQLGDALESPDLPATLCQTFMRPIFARGRCYADALPALRALRSEGLRTAIVSNTPWGSPSGLWQEDIARLGLRQWIDAAVFCGDVGWRKPARQIFEYALDRLQATPEECLFVGDDPRWDLTGPRAVKIEAILIDRRGALQEGVESPIGSLGELIGRLQSAR
jgi:putative hydrolase of the HAD superfamily